MTPILGIMASSRLVANTSFESIATATGTGASGTITFSSIPATFKHLQIRAIVRGTAAFNTGELYINFNSDTSASYARHFLTGSGSAASASGLASQTKIYGGTMTSASAAANIVGTSVIDIIDYASTSKNKTTKSFSGEDRNGAGNIYLFSGLWASTAAISTITLTTDSTNFTTSSIFALYGIKG